MVDAVQCLYMHGAIHELTKKHGTSVTWFNMFTSLFSSTTDNLKNHRFDYNAHHLEGVIKRPWNKKKKRDDFEKRFSTARWTKLKTAAKEQHSLQSCNGCSAFTEWCAAFPGRSLRMKSLASKIKVKQMLKIALTTLPSRTEAIQELKLAWKKKTGHSLEDDIVAAPNATVQKEKKNKNKIPTKQSHQGNMSEVC